MIRHDSCVSRSSATQRSAEFYAGQGLRGGGSSVHPQQGSLFDVPAPPATRKEREQHWEDLTPAQRTKTEGRMKSEYSVTMTSAARAHGELMDRSLARAQAVTPRGEDVVPKGQNFFSHTERDLISYHARIANVPFETMAAAVAVTSPRTPWANDKGAMPNMELATHAVRLGRSGTWDHEQLHVPGQPGLRGNIGKAAELAKQSYHQGVHPLDAVDPTTGHKLLSGPKVRAFYQTFTHPHDADSMIPVDTHVAGGMAPHLSDARSETMMKLPHVHAFFDRVNRTVSAQHNLTPAEGQSVAWHQRRDELADVKARAGQQGSKSVPTENKNQGALLTPTGDIPKTLMPKIKRMPV